MKLSLKVKSLAFVFLFCFSFFSCKEEIYQNDKKLLLKATNLSNFPYEQLNKHMDIVQEKIRELVFLNQYFLIIDLIPENLNNPNISIKKKEIIDKMDYLNQKLSNTLKEEGKKQIAIEKAKLHRLKINSTKSNGNFYFTSEIEGNNLTSLQKEIQKDLDNLKELIDQYLMLKTNKPGLNKFLYESLLATLKAKELINILIDLNKDKLSAIDDSISYLKIESQIMSKRGEIEDAILNVIEKLENTLGKKSLTLKSQKFKDATNLTREGMNIWYNGKFNLINHQTYNKVSLVSQSQKDIKEIKRLISQYKEIIKKIKQRVLRRIEL